MHAPSHRRNALPFLLTFLLAAFALGCSNPPPANDAAPWHEPRAEGDAPEVVLTSHYVAMQDGVQLAVDVYRPAGLAPDSRLPTLVQQTRYWRAADMRPPISWLGESHGEQIEAFVAAGWAVVSADIRGTGASYGTRPYPWARDEIRDGGDLAAWVVAQSWSDGRLATDGISYSGTAAEFLATQAPEGLAAASPRFSLFDAFLDIAFPGGVQLANFAVAWPAFNQALDANRLPADLGWLAGMLVRGVRPVEARVPLEVFRQHEANGDLVALMAQGLYRDQVFPDGNTSAGVSPIGHRASLRASGLPLYSWSGWFDGAYSRSAIQRHVSLGKPGSRLILGPWGHAGEISGSPTSPGPTSFDAQQELLRFFDHHVRGLATGIETQPPVLYYTMVEDRWKGAESWPPAARREAWHLGEGRVLRRERVSAGAGSDEYRVDFDARTGTGSRWDALLEPQVLDYPDRGGEDEKLLTYTAAPLDAALEVTGHPVVELFIASTAEDGAFFAYLEDVAPDGRVTLVTEGVLRGLHRQVGLGDDTSIPGIPARSYAEADARPLAPGRVAELRFDLLPVSYLFRTGHSIRLALAGADADHFARIPAEGEPVWTVFRNAAHPSRLILPVPTHEALAPGPR
ncbi:MAG: CocE/NonD family hydrolase [Deltaproteobacteria bacterium]|nr:CocE/NonD family hydrolase [Deltaproteobacteria bacterium]